MLEFYLYLIDGEPVTINQYDALLPESLHQKLVYWVILMDQPRTIIHLYISGDHPDEETVARLNEAAIQYIRRQLALE